MGWMRTILLGDIGNRLDIGDNESRIRKMRRSMSRNQTDKLATDRSQDQAIAALQAEVDDLKIAFGAIGNLLIDKGVVLAADWQRLIEAVDAQDDR